MNTITAIRNRILQLCEERNLTINKLATISAVSPEIAITQKSSH